MHEQRDQPPIHPSALGDDFIRERLDPRLRDLNYLCLRDILQAVQGFARDARGMVFDYGCGCSPYRELFAHCDAYVRGDLEYNPYRDRLILPTGLTTEPEATYDRVLSTQVLEHVPDARAYLAEAHRILKPGGEIFVSTHGMFHEHFCPYDYQRWTSLGLEELMAQAGFTPVESCKLTAGIRGFFQTLHHLIDHLGCPERPRWNFVFTLLRRSYARVGLPLGNWIGRQFPAHGMLPASDPAEVYTCISVRARKTA